MAYDDFTITQARGADFRLDVAVKNGNSAQSISGWTDLVLRGKKSATASDVDALILLSLANEDFTVDSAGGGTAHVTVPGAVTTALGNKAQTIYTELLGTNAAGTVYSLSSGQIKLTANAPGGKVFAPSQLAGLKGWIRADQKTYQDVQRASPAILDQAPVASWLGTGGATHAFVQGRATRRPLKVLGALNGLAAIRGDGADDFLEGPFLSTFITPTTFTMFMVAKCGTGGTGAVAGWPTLFGTDDQTLMVGVGASNQIGVSHQTASAVDEVKASYTLGDYAVIKVRHDAGTLGLSINGGSEATASSGNTVQSTLATTLHTQTSLLGGNGQGIVSAAGDICEWLCWNVALSSQDAGKVVTYLTKRWATPPIHADVTLHT